MNYRVARAWLFLSLILGIGLPALGDWPEFRGPAGDGHAPLCQLPTHWSESENITWKTAIHGRGWSSPVILGNQIWLTTATEDGKRMYAIRVDAESGEIVHDLHIFDVEKPSEIHLLNTYASPTPVIEQGRVYVHFGSYGTACLDTETGDVLWSRRDLPCEHFRGPGSSPILFENLLIVHYDGSDYQYVAALDKKTGETVWKTDRSNDYGTDDGDFKKAFSTPLVIDVDGRDLLISPGSKACMAYDPRTGEEIWQVHFDQFSGTSRPVYGHGLLYISTGFGKANLLAVRPDGVGDVTESHVAWEVKKGVPSKPSPLLVDDLIFMVDDMGIASCLDAVSGEPIWVERLGGQFSASPLLAGGLIYVSDHDGKTFVLRPGREYEEVAVNTLSEGCLASAAVLGNALILRTSGHLYRIEERSE
jgi:outer membrane protein assembly factor BamB